MRLKRVTDTEFENALILVELSESLTASIVKAVEPIATLVTINGLDNDVYVIPLLIH